jgi:O-antigen/teichoic acid export membrane protein
MSLVKKVWDGLWTGTVASVIENLLKIPRMMIITRVLGPEFYGLLGLFSVFREVAGKFIQLGTGDAVIQFLASAKAANDTRRIATTIGAAGLIRICTISISLFVFIFFEKELVVWIKTFPAALHVSAHEMIWLLRLLLIGIFIQAIEGPLGNALQGFQAWKSLLVIRIAGSVSATGFPIIAALMGFHLLGIIIAQQLAFLVVAILICYYYFIKVKKHFNHPALKETINQVKPVLLFGLPLIFSQFFMLIYSYTDQLMLAGMGKAAEELSYYEVARNAALTLTFFPTLLRSVMFPASAEFYAVKDPKRLQALFTFMVKHLFWFMFPLGIWMSVLSPLAIDILAGKQYLPAAQALSWLAVFMVMRSFGVPFFTCLVGSLGRTKDQFYISVAGGLLNIILNYFWIPKYGFMGAVYATGVGHLLGFSMGYLFLLPHMKLNFPFYPMMVAMGLTGLTSFILFWGMTFHFLLVIILLPLMALLYIVGIIRMGMFDRQDVGYFNRFMLPYEKRLSFVQNYLQQYARETKYENIF